MMATPLRLRTDRRDDGATVLTAVGELDLSNVTEFSEAVGTAVRDWRPRGAAARPTAVLTTWGRHTLAIYLVHQPVIFGALILARWGGLID